MRILQVSVADVLGGGEKVAWGLFHAYRNRGHASWLAVGAKRTADPDILRITDEQLRGPWQGLCLRQRARILRLAPRWRGARPLARLVRFAGDPARLLLKLRGLDDFRFPSSRRLLELPPSCPEIVHAHNLHGDYFDLGALPLLTRTLPVVLTLHDEWLLSGFCTQSFDCERWITGCGHCPYLRAIDPRVWRDGSAANWLRKRRIYADTRVHVVTPSRWLLERIQRSMFAPSVAMSAVIPNGVDLAVFGPSERAAARQALGLPPDARILLFVANGMRRNFAKDYETLSAAVGRIAASRQGEKILFIGVGENAPSERIGAAEARFVPFQDDPAFVARHYAAADLYVHAARADTFPNAVIEALACGLPVVATAVSGIPEQVDGLEHAAASRPHSRHPASEATGILVPPRDAPALAAAVTSLLDDEPLRLRLGSNAVGAARLRFDLERQADRYLAFYREAIETWSREHPGRTD